MGGTVMNGMSMQRVDKHPLVDELAKQYEVEEVDLNGPVSADMYDALFVVQPSSLTPQQFDRLVDAIKDGVPTAIFEDPRPLGASYITATGDPKQSPGGMFGGGGATPKGDIRTLWDTLELDVPGQPGMQGNFEPELVWQPHNPYPNLEAANELWVFVDQSLAGPDQYLLSNDNEITSGLTEVLAIMTGAVYGKEESKLTHTPLLQTADVSGTLPSMVVQQIMRGQTSLSRELTGISPNVPIAMAIEGAAANGDEEDESSDESAIKVVYVADTDIILPEFLLLRAEPDQVADTRFQFKNVTFALNTIDWLTGETSFIDVRKHEPTFASLKLIDSVKQEAATLVRQKAKAFDEQFEIAEREANEKKDKELQSLKEELQKLQEQGEEGKVSQSVVMEKMTAFQIKSENQDRMLAVRRQKLERERDQKTRDVQREADQEVTAIQNQVKTAAVALPCIPPLIVGVMVFASRRLRERENISKSRLK
ncbi:MAG: ABC transporter permease, partial [Planctomycetota bacterium]